MRVLKFGGTSLGNRERLKRVCDLITTAWASNRRLVVVASALSGVTDQLLDAARQCARNTFTTEARALLIASLRQRHLDDLAAGLPAEIHPPLAERIDAQLAQLRECLDGIALLGECTPNARDEVLASGERLAVPLLAACLQARGLPCTDVDAADLIVGRRVENEAEVDFAATSARLHQRLGEVGERTISLVPGFVAGDASGRVLTLGRGASDYTATLIASALKAEAVEIWTDVSGVLNACPTLVPEASPLASLSYAEAAQMASLGARVLHPQTLEPLIELGIPVIVRNTLRPEDPGTVIEPSHSTGDGVLAVTSIEQVSELELCTSVPGATDTIQLTARVFAVLDRLRYRPLCVATSLSGEGCSWVLRSEEAERAEAALRRELAADLAAGRTLERRDSGSVIALVGGPKAEPSRLAGDLLQSLARGGVRIRNLSLPWQNDARAVPRTALALIDRDDLRPSARLLHEAVLSGRSEVREAVASL